MSHSQGKVLFADGTKYYFEYNGTVDICHRHLFENVEELMNNWRKQEYKTHDKNCKEDEKIRIATTYGGGFSWDARACKKCMLITEDNKPNSYEEVNYEDGLPDWYE